MAGFKRKRSDKEVKNGFKKKRKSNDTKKAFKKSFKNNKFVKRQLDKGDATNRLATFRLKKGRSVAKEGNSKKKVKVSKSLRQKIHKVLDKDVCQGWFKEISYRSNPIGFPSHKQCVEYLCLDFSENDGVAMFSPNSVRQAASALYFGFNPSVIGGSSTDAGQFPINNLKVEVIESNVVYYLKNNTGRGLNIKLYDCSPKGSMQPTSGAIDNYDPIAFWSMSLVSQFPGADNDIGTNPLSNTMDVLTMTPKMDAAFMKHFSVDETIIYLEPGKEYYHRVPGVKNFLYDFAKFKIGDTFSNHQKMNKWTFMTGYVDIAARDAPENQIGRVTNIDTALGYGLLVETTLFTRFKMPEQAGLKVPTLPVAGQQINLGQRRNAFGIKNYGPTFTDPTLNIIDDEAPGDPVLQAGAT